MKRMRPRTPVLPRGRGVGGAGSRAAAIVDVPEASLLDLVDNVLTRGVMVTGDVVIGLANVDLVYLKLSALLCAADKVMPAARTRKRR